MWDLISWTKISSFTGQARTSGPALTLPISVARMSVDDREQLGITPDLVRVSSGIEGTGDLIADFAQALGKVRA